MSVLLFFYHIFAAPADSWRRCAAALSTPSLDSLDSLPAIPTGDSGGVANGECSQRSSLSTFSRATSPQSPSKYSPQLHAACSPIALKISAPMTDPSLHTTPRAIRCAAALSTPSLDSLDSLPAIPTGDSGGWANGETSEPEQSHGRYFPCESERRTLYSLLKGLLRIE